MYVSMYVHKPLWLEQKTCSTDTRVLRCSHCLLLSAKATVVSYYRNHVHLGDIVTSFYIPCCDINLPISVHTFHLNFLFILFNVYEEQVYDPLYTCACVCSHIILVVRGSFFHLRIKQMIIWGKGFLNNASLMPYRRHHTTTTNNRTRGPNTFSCLSFPPFLSFFLCTLHHHHPQNHLSRELAMLVAKVWTPSQVSHFKPPLYSCFSTQQHGKVNT